MGGLSRTVEYKGNRIDIGGHRFFSKSDRVVDWWLHHMPLQQGDPGLSAAGSPADSSEGSGEECTMLLRSRKSRHYFLRKFFEYPVTLSTQTLRNLGAARTLKIGLSYLRAAVFPPRHVQNLEDFFISPLWTRALQDLFRILYGESLGRAMRRDQRRVGCAEDQGTLRKEGTPSRVAQGLYALHRCTAEGHGDFSDREVHVSEIGAGPTMGDRGEEGGRTRRRGAHRFQSRPDPGEWQPHPER